jgi:release factor glutamine methyltransferase
VVAEFLGVELELLPGRVVTPRPATEALVARALARIDGPVTVADVGTGSGAVAVAIALHAPLADVWATDVSAAAVRLARRNARRHGVRDRVHVRWGDLLEPVPRGLDLVVANLPYLPARLRDDPRYHRYRGEPAAGLYAPGDGLGPYRRLAEAAAEWLAPHGALLIQLHRETFELERDALPGLELLAA